MRGSAWIVLVGVLGASTAACTVGAPAAAPEVPQPDDPNAATHGPLGSTLADGLQVDLMEAGHVSCTVEARDQVRTGDVAIEGGAVMLSLGNGGVLDIEAVDVALGDLVLEEHVDTPMKLMNVSATWIPTDAIKTIWSGDSKVYGSANGTLTIRWALSTRDGHMIELADQTIEQVGVDLDAWVAADGRVEISAAGAVPGTFFEWAGLVELSDLSFELSGLSKTTASVTDPEL